MYLLDLLHDLLLTLVFGNAAEEEAAIIESGAHAEKLPWTNLIFVQHLDRYEGLLPGTQSSQS